ncbi:MAG: caspase family protein, partial [Leptolyngbyaceae cyanobacterium bins.59]|nr:caspase family protein [Leptolyngbyaceae cyanobacterium bins.59]
MSMKRRSFLQQIGWGFAAWGGSQVGLGQWSDRYQQVLAEPAPRKLALLVGINQYNHGPGLTGCLTDVELQRELLLYRFGFQNRDILTLTDQQATRENIEAAFVSHLIEQARPGDAIVFHFSGYGSSIGSGTAPDMVQHTLVPFDGIPTADTPEVNDLLEETLLLLLRSLPTDRVTTILDTSYAPLSPAEGPLLGNLRFRSRPTPAGGQPCPAELAFQEQLLSRINASRSQTRIERRSGQMPGVVLAAAREWPVPQKMLEGGKAFEVRWHGFSS